MPSTITDRLQGLTTSVAVKPPCRAATTAAITLSGLQTVDGISLAAGDRVLVKDQASAIDNGIWIVGSGAWTRALDFNGSFDVVGGTQLLVLLGTVNVNSYWKVDGAGALTPAVDSLTFSPAFIDDSATATFLQAGTGAVARTAQAKMREWVSVKDFGAVGDGATDDAAAFALALATGKKVYAPEGKYRINSKVAYTFSPASTGATDNKNNFHQVVIEGAGHDLTTFYFPASSGFEFNCSSFQHVVSISNASITTGTAGGGYVGLKINNTYAYFGEYTAHHEIDVTMRGDDGYAAVYHWSTCIDLFNASNVTFGRNCNLYGPVLGATANTYGTGIKIASSATPGIGTSTEPGYGTGYNLTGVKIKFMGRAIEIGTGCQGFALGPGTEILVGYDGIHVLSGSTEVRQIALTGAQISVNGDAVYFDIGVSACTIMGCYIGVASGKNGIVLATDTGAPNSGGTTIVGNTFVPLSAGASVGIYVATTFNPIVIDANTFVSLNTAIEIAAAGQNVTVGSANRFVSCTNKVINAGSGNLIGSLVPMATGRVGYSSGAGGAVTQATSKSTAVTLNTPCGQITTNNASLAATTEVAFTVNNSLVLATDTVIAHPGSGNYDVRITDVAAGSFVVRLKNLTAGPLTDAVVINYALVASVTA